MFLVILDYTADLDEIDAALQAHTEWLQTHYDAGLFIASGRREPRTGGVIVARGERTAIERAIDEDPFAQGGLAQHTVIEWHPSRFGVPLDTPEIREALA